MEWLVKNFCINSNSLGDYNVLAYREPFIKELKKKYKTRDLFNLALDSEMMYHYWSRCEYEILVEVRDGRVILSPWIGCNKDIELDVTDDPFDWLGFCKVNHIDSKKKKIDIYDQLVYRWEEFVDYCWDYRHKWQRKKKED